MDRHDQANSLPAFRIILEGIAACAAGENSTGELDLPFSLADRAWCFEESQISARVYSLMSARASLQLLSFEQIAPTIMLAPRRIKRLTRVVVVDASGAEVQTAAAAPDGALIWSRAPATPEVLHSLEAQRVAQPTQTHNHAMEV